MLLLQTTALNKNGIFGYSLYVSNQLILIFNYSKINKNKIVYFLIFQLIYIFSNLLIIILWCQVGYNNDVLKARVSEEKILLGNLVKLHYLDQGRNLKLWVSLNFHIYDIRTMGYLRLGQVRVNDCSIGLETPPFPRGQKKE